MTNKNLYHVLSPGISVRQFEWLLAENKLTGLFLPLTGRAKARLAQVGANSIHGQLYARQCEEASVAENNPCQQRPFQAVLQYENMRTGVILEYKKDFDSFEQVLLDYGMSMHDLNKTGEWEPTFKPRIAEMTAARRIVRLTLTTSDNRTQL